MTPRQSYDVVIVGAGTAGCALAARLSEVTGRRVLLLDAGPDYPTLDELPAELARARSMAATFPGHPHNWSFVGDLRPGRPFPLSRGKVVGGSSTVNGTYFIRARRADLDRWAALGNDLWSYDAVLPSFKRSERDLDFTGEFHGTDGPMLVSRVRDGQLRPVSEAFVNSCLRADYAEDPDKNAPDGEGVGPIPRNCVDGIRLNTALTYLAPARTRDNLTVLGDTFVRRVLFEGTRAVAVEAEHHGESVVYHGDEIVLSAGGIKSPHLLMLSGVGPADHLRAHGIGVIHDSPGVGRNAKDHPSAIINYRAGDDGGPLPDNFMPFQVCLNHTAPQSDDVGDLQITCGAAPYSKMLGAVSKTGGRRLGLPSYLTRPLATLRALRKLPARLVVAQARAQADLVLLCSLDIERSTGEISLRSADPADAPRINLNYLSDPTDLRRLAFNVRLAAQLLRSKAFQNLGVERLSPSDDDLRSDDALHGWITTNVTTSMHTMCTARMGPASDATAVVDQRCRVHGVDGLRVVDISIMPTMIRRGPAATAVMIGERAAELFA